jgi:hypothetical protein
VYQNVQDLNTSVPGLSDITTLTMGQSHQVNRTLMDETQFHQPQRPKLAYGQEREQQVMGAGVEVDTVQAFEEPPPANVNGLVGSSSGF